MIELLISISLIFFILVFSEFIWRTKLVEPESTRKIIHISVGTFIAFWPLYMSWDEIRILCVLLFIGILASYQFGVFGAIHNVKRKTSGELWYPIGILLATLTTQPWIFTIAVLHLSIGDGVAALVGAKYGKMHYRIGLHTRSITGSFAFFVISFALCMGSFILLREEFGETSIAVFAITPFLVTSVESISRHGLDNILIPLAVVFALSLPTGSFIFS